jgi:hypothetical protein
MTNKLPISSSGPYSPNCGVDACGEVLAFADASQRVVVEVGCCGPLRADTNLEASNGWYRDLPTPAWNAYVAQHTVKVTVTP